MNTSTKFITTPAPPRADDEIAIYFDATIPAAPSRRKFFAGGNWKCHRTELTVANLVRELNACGSPRCWLRGNVGGPQRDERFALRPRRWRSPFPSCRRYKRDIEICAVLNGEVRVTWRTVVRSGQYFCGDEALGKSRQGHILQRRRRCSTVEKCR
jgi:hypothetical protein